MRKRVPKILTTLHGRSLAVLLAFLSFESGVILLKTYAPVGARSLASTVNGLVIAIPDACLVKKNTDNNTKLRFKLSLNDNPNKSQEKYFDRKQEYSPIYQSYLFVQKSCVPQLDAQAAQTAQRFFYAKQSTPLFRYIASSKRPYCGTAPGADTDCRIGDDSVEGEPEPEPMFIRIDGDYDLSQMPKDAATLLKVLRAGRLKDVALPSNYMMVFTYERNPSPPNIFLHEFDASDDMKHLSTTALRYLYVIPDSPPKAVSSAAEAETYIHEAFNDILNIWASPNYRVPGTSASDADTAMDFVHDNAQNLLAYWSALKNAPGQSQPQLMEKLGVLTKSPFSASLSSDARLALAKLIKKFTGAVFQKTDDIFRASLSDDAILTAASHWWTLRALERTMGCNDGANTPYPNVTALITDQYIHQECRRQYSNRAFLELNRASAGRLDMSSSGWTLALALGSRKERIELFKNAIAILKNKISQGVFPTDIQINFIANEMRQTNAEIKRGQVLTWLGFQPASAADLSALNGFIAAATDFLNALRTRADAERWDDPDYLMNTRRIWLALQDQLSLPKWDTLESVSASGPNENDAPPLIGTNTPLSALQGKLQSLDSVANPDLLGLSKSTKDYIQNNPAQTQALCSAWLSWIASKSKADPNFSNAAAEGKNPQHFGCIDAAMMWAHATRENDSPDPANLGDQCASAKHWLSCVTLHYLNPDDPKKTSAAYWSGLLTMPMPLHVLSALILDFRNRIENDISHDDKAAAKTLINAIPAIQKGLAEHAKNLLSDFLPQADSEQCISPDDFTVLKSCPKAKAKKAAAWAAQLSILRTPDTLTGSGVHWRDNVFSSLMRYLKWISLMSSDYLKAVMHAYPASAGVFDNLRSEMPEQSQALQKFYLGICNLLCDPDASPALHAALDTHESAAACTVITDLDANDASYCEQNVYKGSSPLKKISSFCDTDFGIPLY